MILTKSYTWIIILGIIFLLVIIGIIILIRFIIHKKHLIKMSKEISNAILTYFGGKDAKDIKEVKGELYDYVFENDHNIYYFKNIYNSSDKELKVVNEDEIYLVNQQRDIFKKKLNDVSLFAHCELTKDNKNVFKYVIFYPRITQMIYVKNEIEYQFIYSNQEICNLHFITINQMKNME